MRSVQFKKVVTQHESYEVATDRVVLTEAVDDDERHRLVHHAVASLAARFPGRPVQVVPLKYQTRSGHGEPSPMRVTKATQVLTEFLVIVQKQK